MEITRQTHVSDIVTHYPAATRVFHGLGIDFCCGGKRPLEEICAERGLDATSLLQELQALGSAGSAPEGERDWSEAPLGELVAYILERYHAPLRRELPRLAEMSEKVVRVHGERHPEMLPALAATYRSLSLELASHMMKEEQVLFPYVTSLERAREEGTPLDRSPFGTVRGPIAAMEAEHDDAGRAFERMRQLTNGYTLPEGACNTFRALFHGLDELERETHVHIHLENHILFPRAAELELEALAARTT
jgi:regulator of cell morphogenesis and NO signaling